MSRRDAQKKRMTLTRMIPVRRNVTRDCFLYLSSNFTSSEYPMTELNNPTVEYQRKKSQGNRSEQNNVGTMFGTKRGKLRNRRNCAEVDEDVKRIIKEAEVVATCGDIPKLKKAGAINMPPPKPKNPEASPQRQQMKDVETRVQHVHLTSPSFQG
eukprot:TRINITY_DN5373_c0_g1_i2.p2 TRINITY_DN5373_c0_g1~~TRINITY_DN5373_c0_g1_i2.p2  ORF type:complete len:155 (-),score=21.87 TRINITY_DN5373_c0_g1_i2:213-677(-)